MERKQIMTQVSSESIHLSVVVPVHNEEGCLGELIRRLGAAMAEIGDPYELIFVDDGSTDGSFHILREAATGDPRIRAIRFTRNFGQTPAISAGIDIARGTYIVLLDADLQNLPEDIPPLVQTIREQGVDVVSGWRKERQDDVITRKIPSWCANRLVSWFSGVRLHDFGCSLKVYRASFLKRISLYGEMHRFLPALVAREGGRVMEVPVRHQARTTGHSKYGLERVEKVFLDLFLLKFMAGFATRPIQFFGRFGMRFILAGGLIGMFTVIQRCYFNIEGLYLLPLVMLTMFLLIVGLQTILMGLHAEIGIRIYHECQPDKKTFVIAEELN